MGWGDEVLALGQAERIWRETGRRVLITDGLGNARWSEVWLGHPAIVNPRDPDGWREPVERLKNGPNLRPYLARWDEWNGQPRCIFTDWRARDNRGELRLTDEERSLGAKLTAPLGRFVVIEPDGKANLNKCWGLDRWQDLVTSMPGVRFVQIGPADAPRLLGVARIVTRTFRDGCGILSRAAAFAGPEGALHTAAAYLRVPAAVVFGGFSSPEATGYPDHENFHRPGPESPCGRYAPCPHCRAAMLSITVAEVRAGLERLLAASAEEAKCSR